MNLPPQPDPEPSLEALERLCTARPFRPLPEAWRQAILTPLPASTPALPTACPGSSFGSRLRRWLETSSGSWSPIAAAWLLIASLHHFSTPTATDPASDRPPLSPATLAMLHQERMALFRGLADPSQTQFATPHPSPGQFPPNPPPATPSRNGSGAGVRDHRRNFIA